MASSAAGLIAPSVVGRGKGAVRLGYGSEVVEWKGVLRARFEYVDYVETQG